MAGVGALWHRDGRPVAAAELDAMAAALTRRAPHGGGAWSRGPVGLVHRRLDTTPEAASERAPSTHAATGVVVAADTRLDERAELARELGLGPASAEPLRDSELVLWAYLAWGEACVERLLGDFAILIWDPRRRLFFCARDHFGTKPLVYTLARHRFAAASDLEALLCLPGTGTRRNEGRIADFLATELEGGDATSTFYADLLRLPPAHVLSVWPDGYRLRRYWRPAASGPLGLRSDEDYAEAFRERLERAVASRLRGLRPPGSMLSGGLDSSSIACLARDRLAAEGRGPLATVSALTPEGGRAGNGPGDDGPFIRSVVASGGLEPHDVLPAHVGRHRETMLDVLTGSSDLFDNLGVDLPLLVYATAREAGLDALLDGVDGDLVTSQPPTVLAHHLRRRQLGAALREARATARLYDRSVLGALLKYGVKPLLPRAARRAWRRWRQWGRWSRGFRSRLPGLLAADFARRSRLEERLEGRSRRADAPYSTPAEEHALRLASPDLTVALERYDRLAARHAIEPRHPLLDRRVVDFCLSLPAHLKLRGGTTKWILRHAMSGTVPECVRQRTSWWGLHDHFFRRWLDLERERLLEVATHPPTELAAYVDLTALREACARCYAGPVPDDEEGYLVWQAASLAYWLDRHSRQRSGEADAMR